MRKKRILYIEANMDGTIGGSYYSLLYLLEGLNKDRYEPFVIFCEDNILIPKFRNVTKSVILYNYEPSSSYPLRTCRDFIKLPLRFCKHLLFKQFDLRKILLSIRPDLVHLNNSYTSNHEWILACWLNNAKIIAHDRGSRPPASLQTKLFVKMLDAIVCVSDAYLKNILDQGLKPKKAVRVYNGLDPNMFDKFLSQPTRQLIRNSLGIDHNEILVGMIGNIDYWKGQLVFVKSIKQILDIHGSVKAIIVGKTARAAGKYEEEIRKYIQENGIYDKVSLLGFRKDVPELLTAMDIFVHASVEPEPFGRVILEAMAMAKPIVATNGGGTPEQLVHGKSGLLVPMNNSKLMAQAVQQYIEDMQKAKEFGNNALKSLKQNFSIANMVHGIEKVYEEVLSESQV